MKGQESVEESTTKKIIRNLSYTFFSNIISLLISGVTILILPRVLGVKDFGYWQLYVLYSSYLVLLQLGWADGLYLRIGGMEYKKLDFNKLSPQFYLLFIYYVIISSVLILVSRMYFFNLVNNDILGLTLIAGLFLVPKYYLFYIMQATNRIKEYSIMTILEKIVFIILVAVFLLLGYHSFSILILADIIGKVLALIGSMIVCIEVVQFQVTNVKIVLKEAYTNVSVGIKLLFANMASSLLVGIVRLSIEKQWGIEVFGKISLTLSLSNLFLIFINSMGMVFFPMLKNVSPSKYAEIYNKMRTILTTIVCFALLLYFPMKPILSMWLPQYKSSLDYMGLLFPIIVFESKTSLICNTFFKTLRLEKKMLVVNGIALLVCFLTTYLSVFIFQNIDVVVLSIVFILGVRSILAEIIISRHIEVKIIKNIISECLLCVIFVCSAWFLNSLFGFCVYLIVYVVFVFLDKENIIQVYNDMVKNSKK